MSHGSMCQGCGFLDKDCVCPDPEVPTLRDQFAMSALTGLLAFPGQVEGNATKTRESVTTAAYNFADAMLAEREKKK